MQIFRFANPEYLYLLAILPVLLALHLHNRRTRKKKLGMAGDNELIVGLIPEYSVNRNGLKFYIMLLAVSAGILMVSQPQFGSKIETVKKQGVEIIIALDVSNSMLAEDIQPNRLERAKQSISRLVDRLENDKIGLIVFAGDAYTQIPVTSDYVSAKMFLSGINPGIVPKQGTSISSAIKLGTSSFSPAAEESKALIVITDGENHEDDPVKAAEEAAARGIVIHTVGIGSSSGVPIPLTSGTARSYLKDREGETVISRLDENILKKVAIASGGKYVRATNTSLGLGTIFDEIREMDQQEMEGSVFSEYNDQFQVFAAIMLLLILIDYIIMERKNRRLSKIKLFEFKI